MMNEKWFVGTSGWTYRGWSGIFYPETLKASDLLPFYAHRFNTVEVNTTFYRFPSEPLLKGWKRKSPSNFVFSVKASRYFTHLKRLKAKELAFQKRFEDFLIRLAVLETKMGPILFQLPPNFQKDMAVLEDFLSFLPKGYRFAIEFRHADWFCPEVYELLIRYQTAIAIVSAPGIPYVPLATAPFVYFRLHGASSWYNYHYSFDELKDVALKMVELGKSANVREVFAYFDNDVEGYAVENARALVEILQTVAPVASK